MSEETTEQEQERLIKELPILTERVMKCAQRGGIAGIETALREIEKRTKRLMEIVANES